MSAATTFRRIPGSSAYKVFHGGAIVGEVYPTDSKQVPWVAVGVGNARTRRDAAARLVASVAAGNPVEERWAPVVGGPNVPVEELLAAYSGSSYSVWVRTPGGGLYAAAAGLSYPSVAAAARDARALNAHPAATYHGESFPAGSVFHVVEHRSTFSFVSTPRGARGLAPKGL